MKKNQGIKRKTKSRITSICLAFVCLLTMTTGAFAEIASDNLADAPEVRIVAAGIDNGTYLELGMSIDSGAEKTFQSAGMVLSYDPNKITPVKWKADPETETLPAINVYHIMDGDTNPLYWDGATPLDTKGADQISGKTALAYRETVGSETTGYLYLAAEAPKTDKLSQAMPPEATPLMETAEPTPTEPPAVTPEPTDTPEQTVDEGEGETPTETPTETPGETTEPTPPPGKQVTTKNGVPVWTAPETEAAVEQAVVVRFLVNVNPETMLPYPLEEVFSSIDIVQDKVTVAAAPEIPVLKTSAVYDKSGVVYYPANNSLETMGVSTPVKLSMLRVTKGKTSNSGGDDPSNFMPIVLFDWDESTLIGSLVVSRSMSPEDITTTINEYAASFMPPNADGSPMDMSTWNDETAKAYTTYDPHYVLTSHNGYSFGKFIELTSPDYTVYGRAVAANDAGEMVEIPSPAGPDYSKISGGLILKAAYIANTTMDSLALIEQRNYVVSNSSMPDAGYYGRYGTSTNYSLKFKVTRQNTDNQPVQRPRMTALRIIYDIGGVSVYSLMNIKNVDEQIVEIAAPANATSASATVIDTGGVSNWVGGAADRSNTALVNAAETGDELGYVIYGTVNYINETLISTPSTSTFTAGIFTNAKLTVSKGNVFGTTSTGAAALRTQAVKNLKSGQTQKLEAEGTAYLSHQEMANVIKTGNYKTAG